MAKKGILERLGRLVVEGDVDGAKAAAKEAMAQKLDPIECIEQGLSVGMDIVSGMFDRAEMFVPQILLSADAFTEAVEILKPHIKGGYKAEGKVIVHVAEGDIHDIGKNILKILLSASGFEMLDLGRDVPAEQVVDMAVKEEVDIITGSALMTTTMPSQREIIDLLKERGIRDKFKCMFGGAPTTQEWVSRIGGDAWADNAPEGVLLAKKFVGK